MGIGEDKITEPVATLELPHLPHAATSQPKRALGILGILGTDIKLRQTIDNFSK
jgi:hypothetical protein